MFSLVHNLLSGSVSSQATSATTSSVPPSPELSNTSMTGHNSDSDELPPTQVNTQPLLARSCSEEAKLAAQGNLTTKVSLLQLIKQNSYETKTQTQLQIPIAPPLTLTTQHEEKKQSTFTATPPPTAAASSSSSAAAAADNDNDFNFEFGFVNYLFEPEKVSLVHKCHVPMSTSVRQRYKRKMRKNRAKKKQEAQDKKWKAKVLAEKLAAEKAAQEIFIAKQKAAAEAMKKAQQEREQAKRELEAKLSLYQKAMQLQHLEAASKAKIDKLSASMLLDYIEKVSKTDSKATVRAKAQARIEAARLKAEEQARKKKEEEELAKKKAEEAAQPPQPLAAHLDPAQADSPFVFPFTSASSESEQKEVDSMFASQSKTFWSKGTGYGHGGQSGVDASKYLAQQKKDMAALRYACRLLVKVFKAHTELPFTIAQLEESALIPMLESYLCNDSITDVMEQHSDLYIDLLHLVEHIALHPTYRILLAALPEQRKSILQLTRELATQAQKIRKFEEDDSEIPETFVLQDFDSEFCRLTNGVLPEDLAAHRTFIQCIIRTQRILDKTVAPITDTLAQQAQSALVSKEKEEKEAKEAEDAKSADEQKNDFETYVKLMNNFKFDEVDDEGFTTHKYKAEASSSSSAAAGKGPAARAFARRLATEYSDLSKSLPIHPESSIFVRQHDTLMKYCRFMVSGPKDTPYENGLFLFDAYFPDDYPRVPPKVNLYTTGYGAVRFNPNLYHCGKVCLSILGTWGGGAGEGWVADQSTFLQVLISIQSLVFVPEPYFNEPGYERTMGTPSGQLNSENYSKPLYLETIRWAMIDQMKKPPKGFEDIVRIHFALKKKEILAQVEKWKRDKNPAIGQVMEELTELLDKQVLKDTDAVPKEE